MNSAKKFLTIAGAFALATLVFTLSNPKTVHAFAATLVQVVNTSQNPVPVAGTLGIDPSNNSVQVANTPTVNVGSLPAVQVGSLPAVQVSNQLADHAVQAVVLKGQVVMLDGTFTNTQGLLSGASTFQVPAGKRLVIQSLSLFGDIPTGETLTRLAILTFTTTSAGLQEDEYDLVPVLTGTVGNTDHYRLSQELTAYSDQNQGVTVSATRPTSSSEVQFHFTVSGYLVDCPGGSCPVQP
jgi:hypothetical protein